MVQDIWDTILKERFNDVSSFDMYPDDYRPEGIDVNTDLNSIPRNNFDLITCFEVIEHMDEVAQNKLMDDLCSLLNDQGTLYISTVRKMDPPPTKNRQVEHIKELSFDELYKVCSERFHNVYTFGQVDQTISTFNIENQYHFVFICSGRK